MLGVWAMATIRYKWRYGRYVGVAAIVAAAFAVTLPRGTVVSGKVFDVVDGDTLKVRVDSGIVTVRVWGVDCPELLQKFGAEAAARAAELTLGKTVGLKVKDRDPYGRTVAEVKLPEGYDLADILIAEGLGWWYRNYAARDLRKAEIERSAREGKIGLWSDRDPVAPWEYRKMNVRKRDGAASLGILLAAPLSCWLVLVEEFRGAFVCAQ